MEMLVGEIDISQAKQAGSPRELFIRCLPSWEVREGFSEGAPLQLESEGSRRRQVEITVYGKGTSCVGPCDKY